ncbi:MAG: hypothetical protein ACREQ8_04965 [Woeseiaceae bacterium]
MLPAAELLGDCRYADARNAYETSLARSPNRFYSLSGAARAAELDGDRAAAARYYRDLVALAGDSGSAMAPVQHARGYLAER